MGIYIKGMEMPKTDFVDIRIFPNGKAENARLSTATMSIGTNPYYKTFNVVEVPPHGRLIDADALKEEWKNGFYKKIVDALIDDAPTIIEGGDMTIDEAIKDIRDCVKPVVGGISLDMAIKALEKEQEAIINISKTIKVVTTNADRIRNMTDEELAKKFAKSCIGMICKNGKTCYDCWLEWLKQETGT